MSFGKFIFSVAKTKVGDYIVGVTFKYFSQLLPVKVIFKNKYVFAFLHPKPYWKNHIVIVPIKKIKNIASIKSEDAVYLLQVYKCVQKIVSDFKWVEYSVLVNGGKRQNINQLHFHLFCGKKLVNPKV